MIIGVDIDGTLTRYPEFFRELAIMLQRNGGRAYLITGLGYDGAIKKLEKHFPDWDGLFELVTTRLYNADERSLIGVEPDNEKIVGRFKQRMCQELGVDVMFDDQALIHREFGPVPIFQVK